MAFGCVVGCWLPHLAEWEAVLYFVQLSPVSRQLSLVSRQRTPL